MHKYKMPRSLSVHKLDNPFVKKDDKYDYLKNEPYLASVDDFLSVINKHQENTYNIEFYIEILNREYGNYQKETTFHVHDGKIYVKINLKNALISVLTDYELNKSQKFTDEQKHEIKKSLNYCLTSNLTKYNECLENGSINEHMKAIIDKACFVNFNTDEKDEIEFRDGFYDHCSYSIMQSFNRISLLTDSNWYNISESIRNILNSLLPADDTEAEEILRSTIVNFDEEGIIEGFCELLGYDVTDYNDFSININYNDLRRLYNGYKDNVDTSMPDFDTSIEELISTYEEKHDL